ncbi:MAG: oligosaccharide flippase family protein [Elusimicrobia bacterium]|nr:oligosaccharide flippase family protein [Elusimicrobiota bacterium]
MSKYSEIFHSSSKYFVLKIFFQVLSGFLSIFVVRLLGPDEYGRFSLVTQLIVTIGLLLSFGFSGTLSRFLPEINNQNEKKNLCSQSFEITFIAFLLFSLFFVFSINKFPKLYPIEIREIKNIFLFLILLYAFINIFQGVYRGLGKFLKWSILEGAYEFFWRAISIIIIVLISNSFKTVIYNMFFVMLFFIAINFVFIRKNLGFTNLNIRKDIFNFGLAMFVGQILFILLTTLHYVMLRVLLKNPVDVGYYSAGLRVPQLIESLSLASLPVPFLYYFSHPDTVETKEKIVQFGSKTLGIAFGFISLVIFSFADKIIPLLFTNVYAESIKVTQIYSFTLFLFGLQAFFGPFFYSINRPFLVIAAGFIYFIISTSLNFWLIPAFKSTGPAISAIAGLTIQTIIITIVISKYKIPLIKTNLLLLLGLSLSIITGLLSHLSVSIPVFAVYIISLRLLTIDDFLLIKKIIMKQKTEAKG